MTVIEPLLLVFGNIIHDMDVTENQDITYQLRGHNARVLDVCLGFGQANISSLVITYFCL